MRARVWREDYFEVFNDDVQTWFVAARVACGKWLIVDQDGAHIAQESALGQRILGAVTEATG